MLSLIPSSFNLIGMSMHILFPMHDICSSKEFSIKVVLYTCVKFRCITFTRMLAEFSNYKALIVLFVFTWNVKDIEVHRYYYHNYFLTITFNGYQRFIIFLVTFLLRQLRLCHFQQIKSSQSWMFERNILTMTVYVFE